MLKGFKCHENAFKFAIKSNYLTICVFVFCIFDCISFVLVFIFQEQTIEEHSAPLENLVIFHRHVFCTDFNTGQPNEITRMVFTISICRSCDNVLAIRFDSIWIRCELINQNVLALQSILVFGCLHVFSPPHLTPIRSPTRPLAFLSQVKSSNFSFFSRREFIGYV